MSKQLSTSLIVLMILATVWVAPSQAQQQVLDFFGKLGRNIPLVGACDRIVYRGVMNCLTNFGPSTIVSKGRCCAFRKYHACIEGLDTGLGIGISLERCPKRSYSMKAIRAMSDAVVGFPLSSCPKRGACKKAAQKRG